MKTYETIIDVNPVEHSSSRVSAAGRSAGSDRNDRTYNGGSTSNNWADGRMGFDARNNWADGQMGFDARGWNGAGAGGRTQTYTYYGDQTAVMNSAGSVFGGLAQMAVGAGLVMIGVPMLILPGPGLLSIAGGLALAAHGARKVFGMA